MSVLAERNVLLTRCSYFLGCIERGVVPDGLADMVSQFV